MDQGIAQGLVAQDPQDPREVTLLELGNGDLADELEDALVRRQSERAQDRGLLAGGERAQPSLGPSLLGGKPMQQEAQVPIRKASIGTPSRLMVSRLGRHFSSWSCHQASRINTACRVRPGHRPRPRPLQPTLRNQPLQKHLYSKP
jgi:hypothetical protein